MRPPAFAARWPALAWVREAAGAWTWRDTALGLAVGTLGAVQTGILTNPVDHAGAYLRWWLYQVCQFGLPVLFAVRVADRATDQGVGRIQAYTMAVAIALVVGAWLGNLLVAPFDPAPFFAPGALPTWPILQVVGLYGLGVAAYADWRRERQVQERIRAWQLQRAQRNRDARAAQLLALQARVDPQLLFDTMKRIERLMGTSPAEADLLLTRLIDLLRAMSPASGARASTLEREVALVEAYGHVVQEALLLAPALRWNIAAPARRTVLAPMVLLPTLRALVAAGTTGLQVDAQRQATRLRLRISSTFGDGHAMRDGVLAAEPLRERLRVVHGDTARLHVENGVSTVVDIEVPCRDDEGTHR